LVEATDAEQLAFAASNQRAIVTFNHRDFAVLHAQYMSAGNEHWGFVFSTEETLDVLRRRLLRLLNTLSDESLKNQIRWLNEFR
jgi:hypothetical protein